MDQDLISLEVLIATQQTAKWTYWMMFATWFAGAATFSAVILSLFIANRKPVPKINVKMSGALIPLEYGSFIKGYGITISNVGVYPLTLSSICWEYGGKQQLYQFFDKNISSNLPKKIEHGESAYFLINPDNFSNWIIEFRDNIIKGKGKISKLKLVVTLATGLTIRVNAVKSLKKTLKDCN